MAQVAGVSASIHRPYEDSSGELDPRIEEVNEAEWVVKKEAAGLLASALEDVTFEDAYQWEEIEAYGAEKRKRILSEEEAGRKRTNAGPSIEPLIPGTTGRAFSEAGIVGAPTAPKPDQLPTTKVTTKRQRRARGEVNPIRMMRGMAKFNVVSAFRDTEVRGLTWGQYLEDCPAGRSELARGLVKERQMDPMKTRKGKGKAEVAAIDTYNQDGRGKAPPETPSKITNFYTVAKVSQSGHPDPKIFQVSKVLIDGGSVLNMIPQHLAEQMGLTLIAQNEVLMRTAASTYHSITHYVVMDISIAGVTATIRCYC